MTLWTVVGVLAGLGAGVVVAVAVLAGRQRARLAAAHLSAAQEAAGLRAELARTEAALDAERQGAADRQAAWEETRRQLSGEFAELSAAALARNNAQFLELADARLREAQQAGSGDLEQRKAAIEALFTPLREQLGRYEAGLRLLELERQKAYTGLTDQVRQLGESHERLQAETRNLVTALRAPATRGRWGEMQLRRVVEMAGMLEHCDFDEQVTTGGEEGRLRPDLVVRLPGGRCVVVDAKVPLQAFLEAVEATDEETRRAHLQAHARQLRTHVDALTRKAYWQQFESSPEFVVAFVPGDPLLAAAFEADPSLLEHAMANHVVLATPTNLIALLRTVAAAWQQEAVARGAREVQQIGRELYKRLCVFGEHLSKAGRGLAGAVDAYNKAVGSLERNVLPQARRFGELGVVGPGDRELAELDSIDAVPRQPESRELSSEGAEGSPETGGGPGDGGPALELVADTSAGAPGDDDDGHEPPTYPEAAEG